MKIDGKMVEVGTMMTTFLFIALVVATTRRDKCHLNLRCASPFS